MKQILQIIGAKNMGAGKRADGMDSMMEVYCIPFTSEQVKMKKPSLFDIASGGAGLEQLMRDAQQLKTNITTFYVPLDLWLSEFKNKLLTKIELDVSCKQCMEEQ